MKKYIINFSKVLYFLGLNFSIYACGDGGKTNHGGLAKASLPKQTTISYNINLDDTKISTQEGNKIFYNVPVGTEVVITATIKGPHKVGVLWNMNIKRLAGSFPIQRKTTWTYKPYMPSYIEVSGSPDKEERINGIPLIVNNEKIFVIEWVDDKKVHVKIESLELLYEKENYRARFSYIVNFKNMTDQEIDLTKLDYKYIVNFNNQPYIQKEERIRLNNSVTLKKNDTYSVVFHTDYIDDDDKIGEENFRKMVAKAFSSLNFILYHK